MLNHFDMTMHLYVIVQYCIVQHIIHFKIRIFQSLVYSRMILWYILNGYILEIFLEYMLEILNLGNCINTCNILGPFQGIQHQSLTHQSSILVSPHLCVLDLYFFLHALMSLTTSRVPSLATSSSKFICRSQTHHLCSILVCAWCVSDNSAHLRFFASRSVRLYFCLLHSIHLCYFSVCQGFSVLFFLRKMD